MLGYQRSFAGKGYRRSSYGRSYYGRRWGSTSKKSLGAARASKTGNKISYYNAQVSGYAEFLFISGSFTSNVLTFDPFYGKFQMAGAGSAATYTAVDEPPRHGAAVMDKGFRLMCAMNDQCRITKMTVKLQPATAIPNNAALRVYSTVDRNMTYDEYNRYYTGNTMMDDTVTAKDVMENQGALVQTFNSNRVSPLYRSSFPTDIKEKTAWCDCSIRYNTRTNESPLDDLILDGWYNGKCDYAPAFHYCCQSSVAASTNSTFIFGYTVEYTFAFRNPKSGLDLFIKMEGTGYTNPVAKGSTKSIEEDPKTKKELEDLAASLTTDKPDDEEEVDDPDPKS